MNRLLGVLSVLCLAFTAAAQTNPIAGTWTLVFDDEFNGTTLNTNLWNPSGWVDNPGELETYYATNVVVTNGLLQLWVYHPSSGVYTSGKVTTMDKFWQKYGYFEASINVPRIGGFWPVWWLLKEPYNTNDVSEPDWPPEVDIFEIVGESGGAQTSISCNVYYGPNYPLCGGGSGNYVGVSGSISDATTGFHTYGYQWTPTSHTFYQDGVKLGSTSSHPYTLYPMWAILQMAIYSTPVGTLPAAMQVDYVRIWALTNQLPPIITSQPSTQTVVINTPATFSVTCTNALSYQWTMAGTNVTGATSSTWTYTPSAVQTQRVSVVVTNAYGGIQSGFVQLQAQVQSGPLAQIGVSPANASVAPGGQQQFSATGADLLGDPLVPQPAFIWSVSGGGTIDGTGLFTAGSVAGGPFSVTAASGGITGVASVSVVTASGGTIGNTQEGTSTDTMWDNGAWINLGRFQAGSNMVVSTMFAKVGAASGGYKCAIYTEKSGSPTALLGGTAEVRGPTNGWNVFPLTSLITLTNGQYYWLAIWSDDANAQVYYSDTSGTLRWGQYNYGTWPNPIATSGGSSLNYSIYATGPTVAGVTASGITADNKVYDGTTAATISTNGYTLSGLAPGDAGKVSLATNGYVAAFASAGVSNGIAVSVSGLTLAGSAAGNYTLTEPSGLTANIMPAEVTVSGITANNKVYDGTTAATISTNGYTLSGLAPGDVGRVSLATNGYVAAFASAGVSNGIAVSVSGLTLAGSAAGNYTLTQPRGLTANITAAPAPPVILVQPEGQVVNLGSNATFAVSAGGDLPLFYQWYLNATNALGGRTNNFLLVAGVGDGDAGWYSVVVSNAAGAVVSSNAQLIVNHLPVPASPTLPRYWGSGFRAPESVFLGTDPDGDSLFISWVAPMSDRGAAVSVGEGWVTYAPLAGLTNGDTFDYTVADGRGGFSAGTARVVVLTEEGPTLQAVWESGGAGALRIVGSGIPYRSYTFEFEEAMGGGWQPIGAVMSDASGFFTYVESLSPGVSNRFYRVTTY
jgi:beta-glucanase (GH16 family)